MDEKKLMTLRIVWGAVTMGMVLMFGVLTLVVAPSMAAEISPDFPIHYIFMGLGFTMAMGVYVIRAKKAALDPQSSDFAALSFRLSIVIFAMSETIGIMGGIANLVGAPMILGIGLLGVALILLAMDFPKP